MFSSFFLSVEHLPLTERCFSRSWWSGSCSCFCFCSCWYVCWYLGKRIMTLIWPGAVPMSSSFTLPTACQRTTRPSPLAASHAAWVFANFLVTLVIGLRVACARRLLVSLISVFFLFSFCISLMERKFLCPTNAYRSIAFSWTSVRPPAAGSAHLQRVWGW